ncbi:MAG: hypothetical protein KDE58_40500, partial [Caldilineaceae bacterium]|nr:hypothetical protein [Caldilineaceae bacterium]
MHKIWLPWSLITMLIAATVGCTVPASSLPSSAPSQRAQPEVTEANRDETELESTSTEVVAAKDYSPSEMSLAQLADADAFAERGDFAAALVIYDQLLAAEPTAINVLVARGNLYRQQGDALKATADYDTVLQLDATYAPAHRGRCLSLAQQDRLDDALYACNQALLNDPTYAAAYRARGEIREAQGDDN